MTRLDAAAIARSVGRLRDAAEADPERFAPLGLVLDDWPEDYDPYETPEARRAAD